MGLINLARSFDWEFDWAFDWALIARGSSPLRARVLSRMSTGTVKTANNDNGVKDISKSTTTPDAPDNMVVVAVVVVVNVVVVGTSLIVNNMRQSEAIPVTPSDDTTSNTG